MKILLGVPQKPNNNPAKEIEQVNSLNFIRAADLISNLAINESSIYINVIATFSPEYPTTAGSLDNDYIFYGQQAWGDFKKRFRQNQEVNISIGPNADLTAYDFIVNIASLFYPKDEQEGIDTRNYIFQELKRITADSLGGFEKGCSRNGEILAYFVSQIGIKVQKLMISRLSTKIIRHLNAVSAVNLNIFSSVASPSTEHKIFCKIETSDLPIIDRPYSYNPLNMRQLDKSATEGLKYWPQADHISSSAMWIRLQTYISDIGRISVNDYGPNSTDFGFRTDIGHSLDDSPSKRVVMLGGSFVYGHNLPDNKTIGHALADRLNKDSSCSYNHIDLSCCKDTLFDQALKFAQFSDIVRPSIVVCCIGLNEINQYLSNYKTYEFSSWIDVGKFGGYRDVPFVNPLPDLIHRRLLLTLASIKGIADHLYAKLFVYLQPLPDFSSIYPHNITPSPYQMNQRVINSYRQLVNFLQNYGESPISLSLHRKSQELLGLDYQYYFIDSCHVTPAGSALFAEIIADEVLSE